MKTVYLGLGSNLGDRERMLAEALARLHTLELRIRRVSSVYETEPVGPVRQAWFLNLVAEAETTLFPRQLLARTSRVELELGRRRLAPRGPRTIDIDILFYGGAVVRSAELVIPHPRLAERRFVLEPLAELAPELRDPLSRRTVRELLAAVAGQNVRKIAFVPELPR